MQEKNAEKQNENSRVTRRSFGAIRKLQSSGRYQARYITPAGDRVSLGTFRTKTEASAALATVQTQLAQRTWNDPRQGEILFKTYADGALRQMSASLSRRTIILYAASLKKHVFPTFGNKKLRDITDFDVDTWWATMPKTSAARNAYTAMSSVLRHAVNRRYLSETPCKVPRAFKDTSRPRPFMELREFQSIVAGIPSGYRCMYQLALGAHLRLAELCALRVSDISLSETDPGFGTLSVTKQLVEVGGRKEFVPTKNGDSRKVVLPPPVVAQMRQYLTEHPRLPSAQLFDGPRGGQINRSFVRRIWVDARTKAGLSKYRFHDIRHTGLTLAGRSNPMITEVMHRGGHRSIAAAMRYQHATEDRDRAIANFLGDLIASTGSFFTLGQAETQAFASEA